MLKSHLQKNVPLLVRDTPSASTAFAMSVRSEMSKTARPRIRSFSFTAASYSSAPPGTIPKVGHVEHWEDRRKARLCAKNSFLEIVMQHKCTMGHCSATIPSNKIILFGTNLLHNDSLSHLLPSNSSLLQPPQSSEGCRRIFRLRACTGSRL